MRALDRYNLLLALLLALLLWLNRQPERQPQPLLDIDASRIMEIRVTRGQQLQLSLLRDGHGWMLSHPSISRASTHRAGSLLSLLNAHSYWHTEAQPSLLPTFGLDQPVLTIRFDNHTIDFGNASIPAGQRYVLLKGQVHLIDESYFRIAGLPARHFRERH